MSTTLSKPVIWGPLLTTKSYVLQMRDAGYFDSLFELVGFSLAAPEADTQDPVMIRRFVKERGFIVEREHYARKAFHRTFSYELVLPPGVINTVLNDVANSDGICRRDFFLNYLCPDDRIHGHFWRFPEAILDELLETTAPVATTEDEEALTIGTTLHSNKRMLYYALGATERKRVSETLPLYAVAWRFTDCANCPTDTHQNALVGGGNGTTGIYDSSDDRFATNSSVTNSLDPSRIITDLYANGDVVIATYADKIDTSAGTATNGGILYSMDGGVTTSIASFSTTAPLYAVTQGGGYYWAAGKGSKIYRSTDVVNWTEMTNQQASASIHYTDIAYDNEAGYLYLAGYNGSNGVAHRIDGDIVTDITTDVNAGANALYRVAVLETDHVVFGGASGTVRENPTANDGGTYTTVDVAGTTSAIRGIGGDKARTIVLAATKAYERSPLTDNMYKAMTVNPGTTVSGNFTALAVGEGFKGLNHFLAVTDTAEVIDLSGYYIGS